MLTGVRIRYNALANKTAESFIAGLNLLRQRAEITDSPYLRAREKFFKLK